MDDGVYEVVEPPKKDLVLRLYDSGRDTARGLGQFTKEFVVGALAPYVIPTTVRLLQEPYQGDSDEMPAYAIGAVVSTFLTAAMIVNMGQDYPAIAAAPLVTNSISGVYELHRAGIARKTLDDMVDEE